MDNIANMLVSIKNAGTAGKDSAAVPFSAMKERIAATLFQYGYITSYSKKGKKSVKMLEIGIAYDGKEPRVTDVVRVSKPSRRVYMKASEIKPVKNGYGLLVLSTPKGIMAGGEARKSQVGGEVLFRIW